MNLGTLSIEVKQGDVVVARGEIAIANEKAKYEVLPMSLYVNRCKSCPISQAANRAIEVVPELKKTKAATTWSTIWFYDQDTLQAVAKAILPPIARHAIQKFDADSLVGEFQFTVDVEKLETPLRMDIAYGMPEE